ncbi:MAG: hypothetical protein GC158_02110 [Cyanobacteria bacterium RI_101]|jgi:hypothetical protein|nr:hypothetical protein [Cyanobacteria bacterium RI_101]
MKLLNFALLLSLLGFGNGKVLAQAPKFALACIGTETGRTINYFYRWGDKGDWNQGSVAPGKWKKMIWEYDYPGENRSPQLTIRYDDDATSRTNFVRTKISPYAARGSNCEDHGKTYNFYQRGDEIYIKEED